ncbi:MAG: HAD family phosphatase [Azospira oryzae]|jgi:HAD superfamily hydrolase (TIGR01509 family)|nr:MAG: HAD family phosphatase [Azospira oryzae]
MSLNIQSVKNIIFDLGGVIINLSVPSTVLAFAKASGKSVDEVAALVNSPGFINYEKGLISDEAFRQHVREELNWQASDNEIDESWNAMLLDIPLERLQLLERLKKSYRIFLLSNTNEIHLRKFNQILDSTSGQKEMDGYFHKAYYSHRMKMRKPDVEIFEFVVNENELNPEETLFLDDNLSNLKGAEMAGIKTFHVQTPELIFSLF